MVREWTTNARFPKIPGGRPTRCGGHPGRPFVSVVFDRRRVGRRRTPRPDHGHSHPGSARFHPNVRPRILDRQRLEPRPSFGLRGGPVRVRDAGDLRARPPGWSPDQPGHRDLPLRALASVAADPAHIRRRTARRGAVRRVRTVGIFVLGPVMRVSVEPVVQSVFGFLPIFQGNPIGTDKFTAGVILAVMIIPTISAVSREALLAVPDNQREAALSLGATRWETTRVAVLRYARAGIFGATILGLGRAEGAA